MGGAEVQEAGKLVGRARACEGWGPGGGQARRRGGENGRHPQSPTCAIAKATPPRPQSALLTGFFLAGGVYQGLTCCFTGVFLFSFSQCGLVYEGFVLRRCG